MYALIQKHKRLAAIVIAVASISFLFWMFTVSDIQQMFGLKRCVASVNGSCITVREFRFELLKFSSLLDREELRDLVKRQVLGTLIAREALYQKAYEMGLIASDKEVAQEIKKDPNFQINGKFSLETYREVLERLGITPEEYEETLRKVLSVQRLLSFVESGVYLTDEEKDFWRKLKTAVFSGKLYLVTPKDVKVDYKPSLEEMKKFYEENRSRFKEPPQKVYLLWETGDKEKAHSIYRSLKEGKTPEGGKELKGKDLADLPESLRSSAERLSQKDPVFISKERGKYYVIFLKEVKGERFKKFEEVKETIKKELVEKRKEIVAQKRAEEIRKALEEGREIKDKFIKFDNSKVEEFSSLLRMPQGDIFRLVFSEQKVFGPYKAAGGYAVLLIEKKEFKKDSGDVDFGSLLEMKKREIVNLFVEKVQRSAEVKVNEEFLRSF